MPESSFANLLWVALVALGAPLMAVLLGRLALPAVLIEIAGGIVLGPSGLGWIQVDLPVEILSLIGLSFLLFLGGTEIEPARLKEATITRASLGYLITLAIALGVGGGLAVLGTARAPLLVAVALSATSLGVVVAVLTDAGQVATDFGQRVITNASVADFGAVLILSVLFTQSESAPLARWLLLAGLGLLVVTAALVLTAAENRLPDLLRRLEGGASEIQVRLSVVLMFAFAAAAVRAGVEAILGAFLAGAILSFVSRRSMIEERLRPKLEAIGYGFLIPVFFVTAGLRFDLGSLRGGSLLMVPLFVVALLLARGAPALILEGRTKTAAAVGLLQATSLSFLVTASQIGLMGGLLDTGTASAMVGAGLVSVALFPPLALRLLPQTAGMQRRKMRV
jgi:Kef-type K+ transport system membrane component KefB